MSRAPRSTRFFSGRPAVHRFRSSLLAGLCAVASLAGLACEEGTIDDGGDTDGMGGQTLDDASGAGISRPRELTLEGFQTFLANETYRSDPWLGEGNSRLDSHSGVNVHGWVRVFFNDTAVQSIQAGNGDLFGEAPHTVGTMIVKEIFSEVMQDVMIGAAVMLKVEEGKGPNTWLYYCSATDGTCTGEASEEIPIFGRGESSCHSCHGGEILSVGYAQVEGL